MFHVKRETFSYCTLITMLFIIVLFVFHFFIAFFIVFLITSFPYNGLLIVFPPILGYVPGVLLFFSIKINDLS